MSLIDTTYFINDIELSTDNLAVKLQQKINTCEPEILIKCLGFDMYRQFIAALAGTPEQKWLDLRDGKEFAIDGIYYNWRGLLNTEKESLIAYYVYYQFIKSPEYYQSGLRQSNTENSIVVNPRPKQCDVYNKMVDWIEEMDLFIYTNIADYTTYNPTKINKINAFNI
jgi:hypothetical protein